MEGAKQDSLTAEVRDMIEDLRGKKKKVLRDNRPFLNYVRQFVEGDGEAECLCVSSQWSGDENKQLFLRRAGVRLRMSALFDLTVVEPEVLYNVEAGASDDIFTELSALFERVVEVVPLPMWMEFVKSYFNCGKGRDIIPNDLDECIKCVECLDYLDDDGYATDRTTIFYDRGRRAYFITVQSRRGDNWYDVSFRLSVEKADAFYDVLQGELLSRVQRAEEEARRIAEYLAEGSLAIQRGLPRNDPPSPALDDLFD